MNKSTKKVVIWESVIGGIIFLLLLVLSVAHILSFVYLFVGILAIVILGSTIITIVIILKKRNIVDEGKAKEEFCIKDEEAKIIAKQKLYDIDILEYEKELIYEKIGHFGTLGNEVPVYIRKMIGYFENSTIAVLVNMKNRQSSFKFYDDIKMSQDDIDRDLQMEANLIVKHPAPSPKMKITEEENLLTGIKRVMKEPMEKEIKKEDDSGGLE